METAYVWANKASGFIRKSKFNNDILLRRNLVPKISFIIILNKPNHANLIKI